MNYIKKAIILITLGLISYNLILPINISKAVNSQDTYIEINEGIIIFKDPVMREAVKSALNLHDYEDIKESDLSKINILSSINKVSSLDGLEKMTHLEFISLDCAKVKDLSPLKNLNLYRIFLDNLNVDESQFSFLKNQKNLSRLSLNNCNLSQIPDISLLKELIDLEFKDNKINDLGILSNLNKLEYLDLSNNNINDISAIKNLFNIEHLDLSNNNIKNISAIKNNKNLKSLDINNNPIEDISIIKEMTLLEWLNISYTDIDNINDISKLYKLKSINCSGLKKLKSIRALIFLPNVWSLELNDNPQLDFNTISIPLFKDNIEYLYMKNSNLTNLNFMKGLNPRQLFIENNKIESLEALKNCTDLFKIVAEKNEIKSLNGLENLKNLVVIYIGDNKITLSEEDKNILSNLLELKTLDISKNPVKDIKFNKMENLNRLLISNIQTTNIENLKSKLPNLSCFESNDVTLNNLMFLNDCDKLQRIILNDTKILNQENLDSLNLPKLSYLEINGSDIKNLSFLKSISNKSMNTMDISNTNIDFSSIPKDIDIFKLQANNCNLKNLNLLPNLNIIYFLTARSNKIEILDFKNINKYAYGLDFSHNKIQEVKNIPKFEKLEKFELEDNIIKFVEGLFPVLK